MKCCVFSLADPTAICDAEASHLVGVAIGYGSKLRTQNDALLHGYVPVCPHHVEYIPHGVKLARLHTTPQPESDPQ